ncbi:MAG: acylphosphatase [Elusimicrobiota bacterium]
MTERRHLLIKGRVQGVGFRWFTRETAARLSLGGWVRNRPEGSVEAEVEGEPDVVRRFIQELKTGLPFAYVDSIEEYAVPSTGGKESFDIRH